MLRNSILLRSVCPLLLLLVGLLVVSCSGSSPTTVSVTINAADQLNPNPDNQPSPTVVRFYDLKSLDNFNNAAFFDIYDNETKTLGSDLLDRKEIEILPGKTVTFKATAPTGTLYLGVLAAFRTLDGAVWRDSFKLSTESSNPIIVTLQARAITLAKPPSRFLGIF